MTSAVTDENPDVVVRADLDGDVGTVLLDRSTEAAVVLTHLQSERDDAVALFRTRKEHR